MTCGAAYDDAAAMCLEHYHVLDNNPEFRLGLLVAYYPSSIPDPKGKFPNAISALVHLATGSEIGITKQSQMVGIQGKRRTRRSRVEKGTGTGGRLDMAYPSYSYGAEPGFAEHDVEEYDGVCADLAWSRSLAAARKVFGIDPDLEAVLERNLQSKYLSLILLYFLPRMDEAKGLKKVDTRQKANSSRTTPARPPRPTPPTRRPRARGPWAPPTSRPTTPPPSPTRPRPR